MKFVMDSFAVLLFIALDGTLFAQA